MSTFKGCRYYKIWFGEPEDYSGTEYEQVAISEKGIDS